MNRRETMGFRDMGSAKRSGGGMELVERPASARAIRLQDSTRKAGNVANQASASGDAGKVPARFEMVHRILGKTHVFTSPSMLSLHISHPDLGEAYKMAVHAVGRLYSRKMGEVVEYKGEDFAQIEQRLNRSHSPQDMLVIDRIR